jgi:hypothetical protein
MRSGSMRAWLLAWLTASMMSCEARVEAPVRVVVVAAKIGRYHRPAQPTG